MARRISVEIVGDSKSVERAFKRAGSAGSSFGSRLKSIGKAATLGIGAAFLGVGLALRRGFGEAMQAEKVFAQTGAVLKSTGGAANVTAKHVDALAGSLSRMSGVDDEAIVAAQNLLLTFTSIKNVKGGPKIFDLAAKAVLDMDQALETIDLQGAAMMVGKALNQMDVTAQGNVRGFMALRRVGVQVTPEMMKMAASFIKAGQPMKAQLLLLKELQTEFGGSAKAAGGTTTGAFNKLRNATDELLGAFSEGLVPMVRMVANQLNTKLANPAFVARVRELGTLIGTKLYNAFASIGTWFQEHWGEIQQGFRITGGLIRGMIEGGKKVVEFWNAAAPVIAAALQIAFVKPMGIVLAAWSGMLEAFSHLPFIGGKAKGALAAVNTARETVAIADANLTEKIQGPRKKPKYGKKKLPGGGFAPGRARGGPAFAGMTYRVGERGPEMLTMGAGSGHISANGGGGISIGVLNLNGVQSPQQFLRELQRMANTNAASRGGRYGGSNLALG